MTTNNAINGWRNIVGSGNPNTAQAGNVGDQYFDATNSILYVCKTSGSNVTAVWISGSGSGTVNTGAANQIAFYNAPGTVIGGLTGANSAVLVTNSSGVPSMLAAGVVGQLLTATTAGTPFWGINLFNATLPTVGGILYASSTTLVLSTAASVVARSMLWGNIGGTPTFSPYSMPATITANSIPFASSTTAMGLIASANNATLVTSASGVPSIVTASVNRQVIRTPVTTLATGTTLCILSTLPITNTQGDQYISQAITPTVIGSIIEIEVQLYCGTTVAGDHIIAGIFQGSTVNAICGASDFLTAAGAGVVLTLKTWITTTSLSPITFAVRMGGTSAGTRTLNQYFGATANSYMKLTESTS